MFSMHLSKFFFFTESSFNSSYVYTATFLDRFRLLRGIGPDIIRLIEQESYLFSWAFLRHSGTTQHDPTRPNDIHCKQKKQTWAMAIMMTSQCIFSFFHAISSHISLWDAFGSFSVAFPVKDDLQRKAHSQSNLRHFVVRYFASQ